MRVILLAESHVWTHAGETRHLVDLSHFGQPDIPKSFVRLVYCLGYGENDVVSPPLERNSGTWQYWKLFWACVNDPGKSEAHAAGPLLKSQTSLHERIRNKITLLTELRARGIWLLDASLIALYGDGKKPQLKTIRGAIEASWNHHLKATILAANPTAIVVVGKAVFDTLGQRLLRLKLEELAWIYQPVAYIKSEQGLEDLAALYRVCNRYALRAT